MTVKAECSKCGWTTVFLYTVVLPEACPECNTVGTYAYISKSDGSTASYYQLPSGATELQDLISFRNMNAQLGEIFRAAYRYGQASHSDCLRDAKKIKFYAEAEIARLEKYGASK